MDDQNPGMKDQWAPPADSRERGYANDPSFSSGEYAANPSYRTPVRDDVPTEPTDEIRSEIDRTRADMSETIDAIQERLRPRNVAARAAEGLRDATVEKVKQMAGNVSDRMPYYRSSARDHGRGNGLLDRVQENPIPAAIAAASLVWLAFGGRRESRRASRDMGSAIYGTTRNGEAYIHEGRIDVHREADNRYAGRDRGPWNGEGESAFDRAQEAMSSAGDRVLRTAGQVRRRGRRMASNSPLVAGAVAAAVGLAIGLALPESERENELMGETRDAVVDRGREAVRAAAERVQDAAGEVQRVAGDALKGTSPKKQ